MQKKALRFIYEKPPLSPSVELFSDKILPLKYLNKFQTLMLAYKMINGFNRLNIQVQTRYEVSGINTRSARNLDIPRSYTALGHRDFFKLGFDAYNKLPIQLKNLRTVSEFKRELKVYLFNQYKSEFTT